MESIALRDIAEPVMIFNLARSYREDLSKEALYDATRGYWEVNIKRAKQAKYALGVYRGVVKEVYTIRRWLPAGSIPRPTLPDAEVPEKRWEFAGEPAELSVRERYAGRFITGLNGRSPFQYSF